LHPIGGLNIKKGFLVIEAEVEVPFGRLRFRITHSVLSWIVLQNPTLLESYHKEINTGSSLKIVSCERSVPHSAF